MNRIDTMQIRRDHPIADIVARYGVELYPCGNSFVGRCPFHDDGGRPNLYVYPETESWYCYRCSVGGDVITFVERIEHVGFRDAVTRLTGEPPGILRVSSHLKGGMTPSARRRPPLGPDERACLAAAVELYHNRLLADVTALTYLAGRGLSLDIVARCRLGYAAGDELVDYLRRHRLPIQAAMHVGLLRRDGHQFLARRVVVPEIRAGQPVWLIGRAIDPDESRPKYLGLPGSKPLLGWETAKDWAEVFLVEGVFDWLTLLHWGYPALALVGTHAHPAALEALTRFERIHLLLDNDEAGQAAAADLAESLGSKAVVVSLPGVKDVAELGSVPEGRRIFARAIGQSALAQVA